MRAFLKPAQIVKKAGKMPAFFYNGIRLSLPGDPEDKRCFLTRH
jgi:hypothetical protein